MQSGGPSAVQARGKGIWPTMNDPGSHGLCGDPAQLRAEPASIADMEYMEASSPQRTYVAGSIIELRVGISTHHMGHFEYRICDRVLDKSLASADEGQRCLNTWTLHRAPRNESCGNSVIGDCQPINPKHPERWYLPLPNSGGNWNGTPIDPLSGEVYAMRFAIPDDLACDHCTLQWYWATGNSCAYDEDYFLFDPGFQFWQQYKAGPWATCANECCGPQGPGKWGEEFWNCADIKIVGSSTAVPTTVTTSFAPSTTSTSMQKPAIRSGDKIFLKTHSGWGSMLDVEGTSVQARWQDHGARQTFTINKNGGDGDIHAGDTIFLTAHTGRQIDVEGEAVQARWQDKGAWQSLTVQKPAGEGALFPGDVACFKSHTNKHIEVEDVIARARWSDCGFWQGMRIEVEEDDADVVVRSGDDVYLTAHTSMQIEVEGDLVQARYSDRGLWQRLRIEKHGGGELHSGDTIFLTAHTAKTLEVASEVVNARFTDKGTWQTFTIESADGDIIRSSDKIFLKAWTGRYVHVDGIEVKASWFEKGAWQTFTIDKHFIDGRALQQKVGPTNAEDMKAGLIFGNVGSVAVVAFTALLIVAILGCRNNRNNLHTKLFHSDAIAIDVRPLDQVHPSSEHDSDCESK